MIEICENLIVFFFVRTWGLKSPEWFKKMKQKYFHLFTTCHKIFQEKWYTNSVKLNRLQPRKNPAIPPMYTIWNTIKHCGSENQWKISKGTNRMPSTLVIILGFVGVPGSLDLEAIPQWPENRESRLKRAIFCK